MLRVKMRTILKDFSDKTCGGIKQYDFKILYNKICQHLEDLYISMSQIFANGQCVML